jgi:hypothetical protein
VTIQQVVDEPVLVEVRCPVPQTLPTGECRPGRLLFKLLRAGTPPSWVHPDNLIELACEDCKYRLRKAGHPVQRVLHRYNLAGELVEVLTVE